MRALLACSRGDDYQASTIWDGLQELLGEENVFDAAAEPTPMLHRFMHKQSTVGCVEPYSGGYIPGLSPCANVGAWRDGRMIEDMDGQADVLVVVAKFLEDRPEHWQWIEMLQDRCTADHKVIYIEGWDSVDQCETPIVYPNACFRREMDGRKYDLPHAPHPLGFAAPSRWFMTSDHPRDIDVFYAGAGASTHPVRGHMLGKVFETRERHNSIIASMGVGTPVYWDCMRRAKLALVPPGGGDCSDTLRFWEAVACGAIPVMVGHPHRVQEHWFGGDAIFECSSPLTLPDVLDFALERNDLPRMRRRMQEHAMKWHTTAARARRMLEVAVVAIS